MRKLTERRMALLLKDTHVLDESGSPLMVYRGEHGAINEKKPGFQSILGSLSFGSQNAACMYAEHPNYSRIVPESPRVYPAYLIIKKPFVTDADDPFVDFSHLEKQLGVDVAIKFFTKFAGHAENTNNWADEINESNEFSGVGDFLRQHPERGGELYANLWPFLDDQEFIELLKAKGFDGAIYAGSGETMLEAEYRVFDESSVIYALSREISLDPALQRQHESEELAA